MSPSFLQPNTIPLHVYTAGEHGGTLTVSTLGLQDLDGCEPVCAYFKVFCFLHSLLMEDAMHIL